MRAAAQTIGTQMATEDGVARAVAEIEKVADRR
jgi:hypothetical protein